MAVLSLRTLQRLFIRGAPLFNAPVAALAKSPRFSRLMGNTAMVTYTGRRSGKQFSIPVAYRRNGDEVSIGVSLPDVKTWWRNFLGDGGPLTLRIHGTEHPGHAVAERDSAGAVTVKVRLNKR